MGNFIIGFVFVIFAIIPFIGVFLYFLIKTIFGSIDYFKLWVSDFYCHRKIIYFEKLIIRSLSKRDYDKFLKIISFISMNKQNNFFDLEDFYEICLDLSIDELETIEKKLENYNKKFNKDIRYNICKKFLNKILELKNRE